MVAILGLFTVNPRKIPSDPNISSPLYLGTKTVPLSLSPQKNDRLNMEIRQKVA